MITISEVARILVTMDEGRSLLDKQINDALKRSLAAQEEMRGLIIQRDKIAAAMVAVVKMGES